ncbi:glycoside hydrolase family 13 protein [Microlunatus elymi]|uniref:Glycoside hydrolase family 13 protein n=1 Tax=Microlunatus elymi TaxID=2596828 RepID=A0A516PYE3_9ACTN|nr:glycoside hydrolase family 13 protein [Microlunatus elymi]QDP96172.1 glycoside hydrolase family 13 protein [Microlunatus elymi]
MTTTQPVQDVTNTDPNGPDADWWRQAVVYQIYPRSFADANGDGIGDLQGIISRIDYLERLGIDAVWLSPFYPSALADGGYDVDDYRDIDPRIGTLPEFDAMVERLHAAGIKLIIDIVPNHSSNRHAWFEQAVAAGPGSPERDRYIFRDGRGADGELPPSDWQSIFGGPAWTRVPDGQWYLHLFAPEQPDWNWQNEDVRTDFLATLKFWGDRGVDGFRIDVAHALTKDLPDELPSRADLEDGTSFPEGAHPIWDRDEVHEIYAEWRRLFNSYAPPLAAVAEAWVPAHRRIRYAHPESLGQAFNFDLLQAPWDADRFRTIITENLDLARQSGASSTWVFSNHDVVRHVTRFGLIAQNDAEDPWSPSAGREWLRAGGPADGVDLEVGLKRARAATLMALALPGSAYLYQGEELGLSEVAEIPDDQRQDPTFFRTGGEDVGRDGCRVPLPWTVDGPSYGFGPGPSHLPQPEWFGRYAVQLQSDQPGSTLELYRRAMELRHRLQGAEELEWLDAEDQVLAFRRPGGWVSITNFGDIPVPLPDGELLIITERTDRDLPAYAGAWVKTPE